MANTFKFGNGKWAVGKDTVLAYNDENSNFKPLPFTFDRASTATVVNKDGLIETVGIDEPRIDFLNNTSGHLLLEPSRTNVILRSEEFNTWSTASGTTVSTNQSISPDGNQTADLVQADGTNAFSRVYKTVSFTSGNNYVYSVFVKKSGSHDFASIRVQGTDVGGAGQSGSTYTFTFSTETLSYEGGGTATSTFVEDYGSGWYRIGIELANSTITSYLIYPKFNISEAGQVLVWGAQLEEGSYATSYIPTSGSAITRSAETANGAGNSNVFNDSEGVLYAEIAALADDQTNRRITISDGSNNNRIVTGYNTNSNYIFYFIIDGGSTVATGSYQLTDIKNYHKVGIKWKQNDFALWIDGVERHTDSSGTTPSGLDSLQFEQGSGGALYFYGKTKDLRVYDTALSDSELQALTS